MYGTLSTTWFFWHLAIFYMFFPCRLMNIFLTQFWTVKFLIHKPQPRLSIFCPTVFWINKYFHFWNFGRIFSIYLVGYSIVKVLGRIFKIFTMCMTFLSKGSFAPCIYVPFSTRIGKLKILLFILIQNIEIFYI